MTLRSNGEAPEKLCTPLKGPKRNFVTLIKFLSEGMRLGMRTEMSHMSLFHQRCAEEVGAVGQRESSCSPERFQHWSVQSRWCVRWTKRLIQRKAALSSPITSHLFSSTELKATCMSVATGGQHNMFTSAGAAMHHVISSSHSLPEPRMLLSSS